MKPVSGVGVAGYSDLVEVGRGASAVVFRAIQESLTRHVALKVVVADLDDEGRARFERECRVLAALAWHPNVIVVHEAGLDARALTGEELPWLAMEYLPGSYADQIRQSGPLAWREALRVGIGLASALGALHSAQVVHRDVKPANILRAHGGGPKLADFGVVSVDDSTRTEAGSFLGTIAYSPPELIEGARASTESDVYSLAATVHELISGQPPFGTKDAKPAAVLRRIITDSPDNLESRGVPSDVAQVLAAAMASDPAERPANGNIFASQLISLAEKYGLVSEIVGPGNRMLPSDFEPAATATHGGSRTGLRQRFPVMLERDHQQIFGRDRELRTLERAIDESGEGNLSVSLVRGEPGIGKTQLLAAAARYAAGRDFTVLYGRCPEVQLGVLAPFTEALRPMIDEIGSDLLTRRSIRGRDELVRLIPGFADTGSVPAPAMEPAEAQARLLLGLEDLFTDLARTRNLALVIDDLHWADDLTLRAFAAIASDCVGHRIALIGSYRDSELAEGGLGATIDRLRRGNLEIVTLEGLSLTETTAFLAEVHDIREPELATRLCLRTRGNPLFLGEVVRGIEEAGTLDKGLDESLMSAEEIVPEGVKAVVRRRLARLDPASASLLGVASLSGPEFDLATVSAVADLGEELALGCLERACDAHLIVEVPEREDTFAFTHALVRETLRESFSTTRRRRLHRRLAHEIENSSLEGSGGLLDAAHHLLESDPTSDLEHVVTTAVAAAEESSASMAFDRARALYTEVVDILRRSTQLHDQRIGEVMLGLARAQRASGDPNSARDTARQAAGFGRESEDPLLFAQSVLELAWLHPAAPFVIRSSTKVTAETDELLQLLLEATELVAESHPSLGAALVAQASLLVGDDPAKKLELAERALRLAELDASPRVLARAESALLSAKFDPTVHPREWQGDVDRIHELARASGVTGEQAYASALRVQCALESGDFSALEAAQDEFNRIARSCRMPLYEAYAESLAAMRLLMIGDHRAVEVRSAHAVELANNDENFVVGWAVQTAISRLYRGDVADILPALEAFVDRFGDNPAWHAAMAAMYAVGKDFERAHRALAAANAGFLDQARDSWWLVTAGLITEASARLGSSTGAAYVEVLRPISGRGLVIGPAVVYLGAADRFIGNAQQLAGDTDAAHSSYLRAVDFDRRMCAPSLLAQSLGGAAETAVPAVRSRLADEAIEIATRLQLAPLLERIGGVPGSG